MQACTQQYRQAYLAREQQCRQLTEVAVSLQEQLELAQLTLTTQREEAVQRVRREGSRGEKSEDDDRTDIESKYGQAMRSNQQLLQKNRELL